MKTIVRRPEAPASILGDRHHLLDFLDAGEHRAERDEFGLREIGDEPRERGLAGAGRTPEDDRLQQVALDRFAQRPARADEFLLALDLVERARAHAFRERDRTSDPAC